MCHSERIPAERSIFVSYAHEDRKVLEGLRKPLSLIERKFGVQLVWDDYNIHVGDEWEREIWIYLTHTPLAILLVSQDFAASDYIQTIELRTLLKRHSRGEVTLLPVMVGSVDLDLIGLSGFQTIPPPECPLKSLVGFKREKCYADLAKQVQEILMQLLAASSTIDATRLEAH